MTNVLIFTETYYPVVGGGETQARSLSEDLVSNDFGVTVMTRRSHKDFAATEKYGKITVCRIPPAGEGQLKKWGLLITSIPIFIKLRRQYDLIFVSGFRIIGIPAVIVSILLGKVCILKADSLGEMSGEFFRQGLRKYNLSASSFIFRFFLWVRNAILKRVDAFVAISTAVANELIELHVDSKIIHKIPNSVDTTRFCPVESDIKDELRNSIGIPQNDKIIIYTGRLVSYKGLPLLLQVWRDIERKYKDVKLLIVGSGGLDINNCEAELREFVDDNNLQDSVRFTGAVENVSEYLQISDIFVFPTESEAFGISLIEAMACGLPVISTHVGGIKDILQHMKNGVVIDANDYSQLHSALEMLITDLELYTHLGLEARKTTEDKYSVNVVNKKYFDLIKTIAYSNPQSTHHVG